LRASDAQTDDYFGWSIAVSGNDAIVGAIHENGGPGDPQLYSGAAYVFQRNQDGASRWGQVQKLMASDPQDYDSFGISVGISGEFAIVGATNEDGGPGDPIQSAGAAYIFRRDQGGAGNWGEVVKLTAPDAEMEDSFGLSVAIYGDTAIVGAYKEDGGPTGPTIDAGAAYVFENIGGFGWVHIKTIRPGARRPEIGSGNQ